MLFLSVGNILRRSVDLQMVIADVKTVPDKTSIYARLKLDQGLIERQPRLG